VDKLCLRGAEQTDRQAIPHSAPRCSIIARFAYPPSVPVSRASSVGATSHFSLVWRPRKRFKRTYTATLGLDVHFSPCTVARPKTARYSCDGAIIPKGRNPPVPRSHASVAGVFAIAVTAHPNQAGSSSLRIVHDHRPLCIPEGQGDFSGALRLGLCDSYQDLDALRSSSRPLRVGKTLSFLTSLVSSFLSVVPGLRFSHPFSAVFSTGPCGRPFS